jgi:periplasmic protein TonB
MKLITTLLISLNYLFCAAQSTVVKKPKQILNKCLQKPQFPGGEKSLYKYLADNVRYPEKAINTGAQGTVYVNFVIRKDGSVSNVSVKKPIGFKMDEEAIRLVKSMPRWSPAKLNGKPVHYVYQLPVHFVLQ